MLTLAETKLHLRVDHADEDTLITALIAAATTATGNYLDDPDLTLDNTAPAPIKAAALLLVGTLYEQRESQGDRPYTQNPTFEALLNPYRVLAA